jgi:hypothetical protein
MTSARQSEANRRNAARSTGPRSRAGKCRSSLNALRHGLCIDFSFTDRQEITRLARELAGEDTDAGTCAVVNLASAQIELNRIRSLSSSAS